MSTHPTPPDMLATLVAIENGAEWEVSTALDNHSRAEWKNALSIRMADPAYKCTPQYFLEHGFRIRVKPKPTPPAPMNPPVAPEQSSAIISEATTVKPSVGVMPEQIWHESRMWDLIGALHRFKEAGQPIPTEWLPELHDRLNEVLASKARQHFFQ